MQSASLIRPAGTFSRRVQGNQGFAFGATQHVHRFDAITRQHALGQRFGDDQQHATAITRRPFDQNVIEIGTQRHRKARRQRPRRGGPDRHRDNVALRDRGAELRRQRDRIERVIGHIDRRRGLVLILDLRFGQRRTAVETPVHGLEAAADMAARVDLRQRPQHVRLVAEVHRLVRIFPLAEHTQPLEIGALQIDLPGGVFAAQDAELRRVDFLPDLAVFLFDRDLDRQAVAIPTGHVGRTEAGQQLRADDDVLEDLVDGVAEVDGAVRIRRPVVQDEGVLAVCRVRLQRRVAVRLFPMNQHARFAPGQVGLHRKARLRQVDRALVAALLLAALYRVVHAITPDRRSLPPSRSRAWRASRCICAVSASRSSNRSSSRSLPTNSTSMRRP